MNHRTTIRPRLLMTLAACAGLSGCIYANVKGPGPINYTTQYTLTAQDFKIIGEVEATGKIKTYLALVATGGNGHDVILKKARAMGADSIIDYTFNIETYAILTFVYNVATWRATAKAIRYNDNLRAPPGKATPPPPAQN